MRRFALVALAALLPALAAGALATRQTSAAVPPLQSGDLIVLALPEAGARAAAERGSVALGVYPESRRISVFFTEISRGAPRAPAGTLRDVLRAAGVGLRFGQHEGADPEIVAGLKRGFSVPEVLPPRGLIAPGNVIVIAAASAEQVRDTVAQARALLLIGVPGNGRTPIWISLGGSAGSGMLGNGIARRPGIVTPYDIAATILEQQGVPRPKGFIGRPLRVLRGAGDASAIDRLAERLERDDDFGQSLAAATVTVGLALGLAIPMLLVLAGRRQWAARVATGGAFATAGYLGALFVPSPRGDVRALVVVGAALLGAAARPHDRVRFVGGLFLAVSAAMAVLTIWAALRPGGEPALSIWGNPLVSWRFFGLQNFEVAFLGGGIVGAVALGLAAPAVAAIGVAVLAISGAPVLGANFVGVLTFGLGAALAVVATARRRFEWWQLLLAGVIAVAAFVLALLSDTGSISSHGGRAVDRISTGGLDAAVDVVRERLTIGADAIRAMPGGPVWVGLIVLVVLGMIWWALRAADRPLGPRVAIVGGLAAALAVLALEDSGVKASVPAGFPALMIWVQAVLGDREGPPVATPAAPPPGAAGG